MSARLAPRSSRRSFLKLGAVAAAGVLALRLRQPAPMTSGVFRLRVASALPLPNVQFLPFPERLLTARLDPIDIALVPAYVAAQLIQKHLLQPLHGPSGRAHDPEGHYTVPFAYRVAALRFASERAAPKAAAWDDLWSAPGGAAWPAFGRVITGAALLRRGYSPNDAHPGHLAQAADDLGRLRGRRDGPVMLVLADPAGLGQANGLRLPAEATMLVEYDWVITGGPAQAEAAREFIDGLRPMAQMLRSDLPVRLIPLMPLPQTAKAQHDEIWAAIAG
jgi:spermidine/putrescine-binding protein